MQARLDKKLTQAQLAQVFFWNSFECIFFLFFLSRHIHIKILRLLFMKLCSNCLPYLDIFFFLLLLLVFLTLFF